VCTITYLLYVDAYAFHVHLPPLHLNLSLYCFKLVQGGHVIPGLIHKAYLAKRDGTDFNIWGSGSPLRQFIFNKVVMIGCSVLYLHLHLYSGVIGFQ
jgi:hypothetical protein